jgi:glyoxylase-like metal-dependent hydrolase (beta-lactamase superfamily II)
LKVLQIPVGKMANFTYIIADEETCEAAVIDPSWDLEKIFDALQKNGWTCKYIINTHSHFDHVLGNQQVAEVTKAKIVQHKASELDYDIAVDEDDLVKVGSISLRIVHTPGHSKDSICLVVDDKIVFTGDTLFVGNCGRTDLPGSDPKEMYDSLFDKVVKFDEKLVIYPGHDYGSKPTSTIGHEKRFNYVLSPRTKQEFLEFMGSGE